MPAPATHCFTPGVLGLAQIERVLQRLCPLAHGCRLLLRFEQLLVLLRSAFESPGSFSSAQLPHKSHRLDHIRHLRRAFSQRVHLHVVVLVPVLALALALVLPVMHAGG
jgi:hypothetical protein